MVDGLGLVRGAEILSDLGVAEVEVAYIEGSMAFDEGVALATADERRSSTLIWSRIAARAFIRVSATRRISGEASN